MKRAVGHGAALGVLVCSLVRGGPPPGTAVPILSPRFFPGWQSQNVCYPFVIRDESDGLYRMYYAGSGSEQFNDSVWDVWATGVVTSADTITWRYPDSYEAVLLGRRFMEGDVVEVGDAASSFDAIWAIGACVIKDGAGFKAWHTGWDGQTEHLGGGITNKVGFRIGYATSPDGNVWTKVAGAHGRGAVLGLGAAGEPDAKAAAHPHVLKAGGGYRMWYEGYDGTAWRILYATSGNGVDWTKQGVVLEPGESGALDELGVRNPVVFVRKGLHELWYQGQSRSAPRYHVMRAVSPDGMIWTRVPGEIVLHPDPPVSGSERILVDSVIVLPDESVQVFFAKEVSTTRHLACGSITNRSFHIYTEVVNP